MTNSRLQALAEIHTAPAQVIADMKAVITESLWFPDHIRAGVKYRRNVWSDMIATDWEGKIDPQAVRLIRGLVSSDDRVEANTFIDGQRVREDIRWGLDVRERRIYSEYLLNLPLSENKPISFSESVNG